MAGRAVAGIQVLIAVLVRLFRHYCLERRMDIAVTAVEYKNAPVKRGSAIMERVKGIEPSYRAWEAGVLPLNYTRIRKSVAVPVDNRSGHAPENLHPNPISTCLQH
jgi:hypothetical protein